MISDTRQSCSALLRNQWKCDENDYNDTAYVVGTCLDGPVMYKCTGGTSNYKSKIKTISYKSDNTDCSDASNANNTTISDGCDEDTFILYFVEECKMPK